MKTFITALFLLLLTGCASVFEDSVQWTDADYGGAEKRVSSESYEATRSQTRTPINTRARVNGYQTQVSAHLNRKATKTCIDHSVIVAQKWEARGKKDYHLIIAESSPGLYHTMIERNGMRYDIKSYDPVPVAEYDGFFMSEQDLGYVSASNIKKVASFLGGTFK